MFALITATVLQKKIKFDKSNVCLYTYLTSFEENKYKSVL